MANESAPGKHDALPPQPKKALGALGKPKGWRKWLYRLAAATLIPTLLLGLLEFGLWLCGYGYVTSFFTKGVSAGEEYYVENLDFGRRFFPQELGSYRLPINLPIDKPARTYRIFVLGESAALGIPDPSVSFARILAVMLRECYPDVRFEVVNTAMPAINSHVVLPIARECAAHQPDLFVILMGNNEAVGPFSATGIIGSFTPNLTLIRANILAKSTRTGQLVSNLMSWLSSSSDPRGQHGKTMFLKSRIAADDVRLQATYSHFRQNLRDICEAGRAAGAQVMVCTVPVNLKDCAPLASVHGDLGAEAFQAWESVYEEGMRLEKAGRAAAAVAAYEDAARIDPGFAELQFRLARCYEAIGHVDEAKAKYRLARDLDALRFRADSTINAAIRDVVSDFDGKDVHLVDAERVFEAASVSGIPGGDFFFEHVHLNFTGNYSLARSVFQRVVEVLPQPESQMAAPEAPSETQCAEWLAFVESIRYKSEFEIRNLLREPPFDQQLDSLERNARFDARLDEMRKRIGSMKLNDTLAIFHKALQRDPSDWMIRQNYSVVLAQSGALARAIEELDFVVRQVPRSAVAHHNLGRFYLVAGDPESAEDSLKAALRIQPGLSGAYSDLANALVAQGKADEAIALLMDRTRRESDAAKAQATLAHVLLTLDRLPEAKAHLAEAFRLNPDEADAHIVMGRLHAQEKDFAKALSHYRAALRSRPTLAPELREMIESLQAREPPTPQSIQEK